MINIMLSGLTELSSSIVTDGFLYPRPEGPHIGVDPRDAGPGTALSPADQPHQGVSPVDLLGQRSPTVTLAPIFTFLSSGTEHQVTDLIVKTFVSEHLFTLGSLNCPVTVHWSWLWDGSCLTLYYIFILTSS